MPQTRAVKPTGVASCCYKERPRSFATDRHGPRRNSQEPHPARRFRRLSEGQGQCALALCALAVGAERAARHGLHLSGTCRVHREIFRGGWRAPAARLCRRRARLARAGRLGPAHAEFAQRPRQELRRLRGRRRPLHERRGAAGLSAALLRARPFHGGDGAAQGSDPARMLVLAHGDDRADAEDRRAADAASRRVGCDHRALARRVRQVRGAWRHEGVSGEPEV